MLRVNFFTAQKTKKYFKEYGGSYGGFGPRPKRKISPFPGHPLWDWGVYPERDDQMPDAKIAAWGEKKLALERDKPFFMGIGFYRPHVPQFAPQKWFDMYPLDEVQLPKMKKDDLADISQYGIDLTREEHVAPTYEWVVENKEEKKLVQSYLACVSFVDAQVGKILDALDQSAYKDNTYVVLYSDHGFHFGEKERYAKRSIWADGSRVPMMIAGPGIKPGVSHKPVQLMDIYPTLLELTNLKLIQNLKVIHWYNFCAIRKVIGRITHVLALDLAITRLFLKGTVTSNTTMVPKSFMTAVKTHTNGIIRLRILSMLQ